MVYEAELRAETKERRNRIFQGELLRAMYCDVPFAHGRSRGEEMSCTQCVRVCEFNPIFILNHVTNVSVCKCIIVRSHSLIQTPGGNDQCARMTNVRTECYIELSLTTGGCVRE